MIIDQRMTIEAPLERVWAFIVDIPAVSRCVPGVEAFERVDDRTFEGALKVKVGPVTVRLQGRITVVRTDPDTHTAVLAIEAAERRISSSVSATTTLALEASSPETTDLLIHTEASILGKLGDFGQSVMRRKADQLATEFGRNAAAALSRP